MARGEPSPEDPDDARTERTLTSASGSPSSVARLRPRSSISSASTASSTVQPAGHVDQRDAGDSGSISGSAATGGGEFRRLFDPLHPRRLVESEYRQQRRLGRRVVADQRVESRDRVGRELRHAGGGGQLHRQDALGPRVAVGESARPRAPALAAPESRRGRTAGRETAPRIGPPHPIVFAGQRALEALDRVGPAGGSLGGRELEQHRAALVGRGWLGEPRRTPQPQRPGRRGPSPYVPLAAAHRTPSARRPPVPADPRPSGRSPHGRRSSAAARPWRAASSNGGIVATSASPTSGWLKRTGSPAASTRRATSSSAARSAMGPSIPASAAARRSGASPSTAAASASACTSGTGVFQAQERGPAQPLGDVELLGPVAFRHESTSSSTSRGLPGAACATRAANVSPASGSRSRTRSRTAPALSGAGVSIRPGGRASRRGKAPRRRA